MFKDVVRTSMNDIKPTALCPWVVRFRESQPVPNSTFRQSLWSVPGVKAGINLHHSLMLPSVFAGADDLRPCPSFPVMYAAPERLQPSNPLAIVPVVLRGQAMAGANLVHDRSRCGCQCLAGRLSGPWLLSVWESYSSERSPKPPVTSTSAAERAARMFCPVRTTDCLSGVTKLDIDPDMARTPLTTSSPRGVTADGYPRSIAQWTSRPSRIEVHDWPVPRVLDLDHTSYENARPSSLGMYTRSSAASRVLH